MSDADVVELQQLAFRYAAAVDAGDVDTFLGVFHPDARMRSYQAGSDEPFAETVGHDQLASVPATIGQLFGCTAHQMTNHVVDVDGNTATGTLLCSARFLPAGAATGEAGLNVVKYVDRYERRAGVWRIAERELHFLWSERHSLLEGSFPPAPDT